MPPRRAASCTPTWPSPSAADRLSTFDTLRKDIMTDDNGIAGTGHQARHHPLLAHLRVRRGALHARDAHQGGGRSRPRPGHRVQHRPDAAHLPRRRRRVRQDLARQHGSLRARAQRDRHEPRHGPPQGARHDARRGARLPRASAEDRAHPRLQEGRHPLARQGAAAQPPAARREVRPEARLRDPRAVGSERPAGAADARDVRRAAVRPPRLHRRLLARRCTRSRRRCCARSARWGWTRSTSRSWTRSGTSRRRCTCATRSSRTS